MRAPRFGDSGATRIGTGSWLRGKRIDMEQGQPQVCKGGQSRGDIGLMASELGGLTEAPVK